MPCTTLNGHSLPVTDMHCGYTVDARLFSVSRDRTLRVWDTVTLKCISTILMPAALECIAVNVAETTLICGTADSNIYRIDLHGDPATQDQLVFSGHKYRYLT